MYYRPNRKHKVQTGTILATSDTTDPELHFRIDGCGAPASFGYAFCRTAGCHRCRKRRVQAWTDEAIGHFERSDEGSLRWLTVMLKPCLSLRDVPVEIKAAKVAWRNIVYRLREDDQRADAMRIVSVSETDFYHAGHVDYVYPGKREQLTSHGRGSDVWLPHLHLIVDLQYLPERKLLEALRRKWPKPLAVDMRHLNKNKTLRENVTNLLSYATKSQHCYRLERSEYHDQVRWPSYRIVEYYNMLHQQGGFSLLRFHIKPRASRFVAEDNICLPIEPMPMVFS